MRPPLLAVGVKSLYNQNMYRYNVTNRAPLAIWMLDDTTPFQEHSGSSASGISQGGSPTTSVPLVAGAEYSTVFKAGTTGRFECNVFKQGRERLPFAIEAWVLPIPKTSTGPQQILSHDGEFDGLSISGKTVKFSTEYTNFGEAACSYDIGEYKLLHVVGIHSKDQNQLWVNGELVASVDLTEDQKDDTYITTDDYLYTGHTTSTQELAVNAVAFYPSLSGEQIVQNYAAGIDFLGQARVAPQFGGTTLNLDAAAGTVFLEASWSNKTEFEAGLRDNVELGLEAVYPAYSEGLSVAGAWTTSVPLDLLGDTSIYGVMVAWSGEDIVVETSLDGSTWTPAVSGHLVSTIPDGYNPTDKDLQIRVSFAGGLAEDPAYLESLSIVGFKDNVVASITARDITVTHPAVLRNDYETNLFRDDNGISLHGGTLIIGQDTTDDPDIARTLELWVKQLSGAPTVSASGTVYRNGVLDSTVPVGEWSLIHIVAAADITTPITITGDCIVGQATLYPTALTADDIQSVWKSYTGRTAIRFTDTVDVEIAEDATPTSIYEHDWAIDSAG